MGAKITFFQPKNNRKSKPQPLPHQHPLTTNQTGFHPPLTTPYPVRKKSDSAALRRRAADRPPRAITVDIHPPNVLREPVSSHIDKR